MAVDPVQIEQLMRDARLRLFDIPGLDLLAQNLKLDPANDDLAALFFSYVEDQAAKGQIGESVDPFYSRYPQIGSLPISPDRVAICALPTRDVVSLRRNDFPRHVGIYGKTGAGKSNLLRAIITQLLAFHVTGVWFDYKADGAECETLANHEKVRVLDVEEIPIALLQRPKNQSLLRFLDSLTDLIARALQLMHSRRWLLECLQALFRKNANPCLSDLLRFVDMQKVSGYRTAQYKEAVQTALRYLRDTFGSALDFAASTAVEEILSFDGLTITRVAGINADCRSLYASLFLNHAFYQRKNPEHAQRLLCMIVDDAQDLLSGSAYGETEQGLHPIVSRVLDARSRKIALIAGLQSFVHTSPAFKQNCGTTIVGNVQGDDVFALSKFLGLNEEQAGVLSQLQPGEIVIRTPEVHAVFGRVPLVS